MRTVRRRHTRKPLLPPPPWEWRGQWQSGPPRTVVTGFALPHPVTLSSGAVVAAGEYDAMLRLYRHTGFSRPSVVQEIDGVEHVCYLLDQEWRALTDRDCLWWEQVDNLTESVRRTDTATARKFGHIEDTRYGLMWVVPSEHYTYHERES